MSGWTKGPWVAMSWEADRGGTDWNVWGPKASNHIGNNALMGDYGSEADARLIATAPDMAEIVRAVASVFVYDDDKDEDVLLSEWLTAGHVRAARAIVERWKDAE